jgi:hypothetical protein
MLSYSTYVFQRRVLVTPLHVLRVATDRTIFDTGTVVAADDHGGLGLDSPFRLVDVAPVWRWRAEGRLINARGRTLARIDLELGPWSADDCELVVRPHTSRPDRWGTRRRRRYFTHAQSRIDLVQRLLVASPTRVRVARASTEVTR